MTGPLPRSRRRVAVSLTALVDLLFMIMFMQYLQLQRGTATMAAQTQSAVQRQQEAEVDREKAEQRKADAIQVKDEALAKVAMLTARLEEAKAASGRLEQERAELKAQNDDLRKKYEGAVAEIERTKEEAARVQQQLGSLVTEMFSTVDSQQIAEVLEKGSPKEDVLRMQSQLAEARNKTAAQAVQALRRASEVQKRVDIWEVHLFRNGDVRVRAPGKGDDALERTLTVDNEDEFTAQFLAIATTYTTPKNLVIILYTHENAKGGRIRGVQAALEQVKKMWAADLGEKKVSVSTPAYTETAP